MNSHLLSLLAITALLAAPASALATAENPASAVSLETALADAHALAARKPGLAVVRVEGTSMLPYFGDGAVLVLRQMPAARLQAGMLVVYTNRFGETVAHRIVAADAVGWIVQGYNNATPDSTRVTDANLQGVIYATFHATPRPAGSPATGLLALTLASTPVALAAPAR